jgi:DNA recombination protein RmuC
MEFVAAALLGISLAVAVFLVLQRTTERRHDELSSLISGVKGEERLRDLERDIESNLQKVTEVVSQVDHARGESITRLETVVRESQRSLDSLQRTTTRLADTLSNSQARGQWGERMADDILRAAGLIEGVNYRHNRQLEGGTGRPDYTFLLPEGRVLHMDVKFPIANYVRYLDADEPAEVEAAERQFLSDVRGTVRAVATREYVDPAQGTLDFMLVFIPNEAIYAFIHERDHRLADDALERGVVLCSPLTLYALLSVIRQSTDAFALAHAADQILRSLGAFNQQWGKYLGAVDTVGRRIDSLQKAYDDLRGTRTRALERRLAEVEQIRIEQRLELPDDDEDEDEDLDAAIAGQADDRDQPSEDRAP